MLFCDGQRLWHMRVEGDTDQCFRRRENDILDLELAAGFEDVIRAHCVGAELPRAVGLAGRGDGSQVDDGVDAAVCHVLSYVSQLDRERQNGRLTVVRNVSKTAPISSKSISTRR